MTGPRPSDRWIPWYFVAFFATLVSVLGVMAYFAVHSYSGLVTQHAYEKGLAYNTTLQAAAQQEALGWKGTFTLTPAETPETFRAAFTLRDAAEAPLNNATVKLWLMRPTEDGLDQTLPLAPEGKGRYSATVRLPRHGQWQAQLAATVQGKNFQMEQRVVVP